MGEIFEYYKYYYKNMNKRFNNANEAYEAVLDEILQTV